MRLRVKDLRQYLLLRNIPTDTCREKEDLVDLVLCHQGIEEEEEDPDTTSLHSRSLFTPTPSTTQSASELSAFAASHEEPLSRSDSSDTNQVRTSFKIHRNPTYQAGLYSYLVDIETISVRLLNWLLVITLKCAFYMRVF